MCFFWVWTIINHYGVFFVECYSVPHISGVSDLENGWPRSTHSWQVNRSQSALVRGPAWWKNGSFSWLETGLIKQWENAWLALWRLTTQGFKGNVDGELEHSLHDGIRRVRTYDVKVLEQEVAPYAKLFMQETDKIYIERSLSDPQPNSQISCSFCPEVSCRRLEESWRTCNPWHNDWGTKRLGSSPKLPTCPFRASCRVCHLAHWPVTHNT